MIGVLKLAAISAVLSAGVVTAHDISTARDLPPGKVYTDRVPSAGAPSTQLAYAGVTPGDRRAAEVVSTGKGDSERPKRARSCEKQVWPHISRHCIAATGVEPRKLVRTITIESREGENTSVLTRVSAAALAQR